MSGSGKDVSGVVGISRDEVGAGTFPDKSVFASKCVFGNLVTGNRPTNTHAHWVGLFLISCQMLAMDMYTSQLYWLPVWPVRMHLSEPRRTGRSVAPSGALCYVCNQLIRYHLTLS